MIVDGLPLSPEGKATLDYRRRVEQSEHPLDVVEAEALQIMFRLDGVSRSDDGRLNYPGDVFDRFDKVTDVRVIETGNGCMRFYSCALEGAILPLPPRISIIISRLSEGVPWGLEYIDVFGTYISRDVNMGLSPLEQVGLIQNQLCLFAEIADACEAAGKQEEMVSVSGCGDC